MSQLVKTKRQANFKDFKRFGAFKGLVEPKNVVFNSFVCKLGLFWHSWALKYKISSYKKSLKIVTYANTLIFVILTAFIDKVLSFNLEFQK
jgi:hypothetical protein